MQAYKAQLRRHLADHGWEVVEVVEGDDWWVDEYWRLESRQNLWGWAVILTFLVDPMWDAPRKKGQGVWAVAASETTPADRLSAEGGLTDLCMVKGRFDEKLRAFVAALDAHRNAREHATRADRPG